MGYQESRICATMWLRMFIICFGLLFLLRQREQGYYVMVVGMMMQGVAVRVWQICLCYRMFFSTCLCSQQVNEIILYQSFFMWKYIVLIYVLKVLDKSLMVFN